MKKILLILLCLPLLFTTCKKEDDEPTNKVEIAGCTDSTACNYDSLATVDDGSCLTIYGCMNPAAINYDSLANCPDSCIYPPAPSFTINFTQTIDGVDLTTNTMIYTNSAGENYDIQTLKYLISDITLHADDGNTLVLDEVHFIDISDSSTFSFTPDYVANNNYTSISFDMGLDPTKNSSNFYVNEDFHATMFWPEPMGGGYHYMKLEGAYINDSTFYNTHTGGTMGMDYSFNNSSSISLNVNDDMGDVTIDINMEINNWYKTPNTISLAGAIMMDMMKQMQLKQNGMTDVFSVAVNQ